MTDNSGFAYRTTVAAIAAILVVLFLTILVFHVELGSFGPESTASQDQRTATTSEPHLQRSGALDSRPSNTLTNQVMSLLLQTVSDLRNAEGSLTESESSSIALTSCHAAQLQLDESLEILHNWANRQFASGLTARLFWVEESAYDVVPWSSGQIEVFLGAFSESQFPLGIRTCDGEILVASRCVTIGDDIEVRVADKEYTIRVENIRRSLFRFLVSHDYAEFRVTHRILGNSAGKAERGEMPEKPGISPDLRKDSQEIVSHESAGEHVQRGGPPVDTDERAQPVEILLVEFVADTLSHAQAGLVTARQHLEERNSSKAIAEILAARRMVISARDAISIIIKLPERLRMYLSVTGDLSILQVRVLNATKRFPNEGFQTIVAQVLRARRTGRRFASATAYGKRFPGHNRNDLLQGRSLALDNSPMDTGVSTLAEGADYWIAITPPIAEKGIPRDSGATGKTRIVFALPSDPRASGSK